MSMSTHVIGIVPPDDEWQKMKAIWDACDAAGVDPPDEVAEFFGHQEPDPKGVLVDIEAEEWNGDAESGFEVDLASVPEHVKRLRFYNSW